jgi:stearoyl-CoA desaturase (Delta-9 desaturase)
MKNASPPRSSTNQTAVIDASIPPLRKVGRVTYNPRLRRLQHIHSAVVTFTGLSGVVIAFWLAWFVKPVSWMDISIFFTFFMAIGLGVTVGFHRHFTHQSFKARPSVRAALAILGCMAAQGPVVFWVALHRLHHEFSDRPGDPHSPNLSGSTFWQKTRGLLHAYIGWTLTHEIPNANYYARDLLTDSTIMWINRRYYVWIALGLALPTAICGLWTQTWVGALEGIVWGGLVRMFAVHNIIWWITSLAHFVGTHDYASRDHSTNNFWIALPTLGESWHNNHHAFPSCANLSFEWWQIDISGMVIKMLERLGLVSDVHAPTSRDLVSRQTP